LSVRPVAGGWVVERVAPARVRGGSPQEGPPRKRARPALWSRRAVAQVWRRCRSEDSQSPLYSPIGVDKVVAVAVPVLTDGRPPRIVGSSRSPTPGCPQIDGVRGVDTRAVIPLRGVRLQFVARAEEIEPVAVADRHVRLDGSADVGGFMGILGCDSDVVAAERVSVVGPVAPAASLAAGLFLEMALSVSSTAGQRRTDDTGSISRGNTSGDLQGPDESHGCARLVVGHGDSTRFVVGVKAPHAIGVSVQDRCRQLDTRVVDVDGGLIPRKTELLIVACELNPEPTPFWFSRNV